ncbi:MAG: type II toxin-antitoxin system VapC family toxin [Candidatus Rokubacteria bacterium]|nr:type II toxin-antitoxin system VapC family toxin [Candidatus Rokubacteria bacterium]
MTLVYLDASAIVKLVVAEPESAALIDRLREWPQRASSALSITEVPRALRRAGFTAPATRRARAVLARVALVEIDRTILTAAAALNPAGLRTLDAIHLATALSLRADLAAFVTYDRRLGAAAELADLEVSAPV